MRASRRQIVVWAVAITVGAGVGAVVVLDTVAPVPAATSGVGAHV